MEGRFSESQRLPEVPNGTKPEHAGYSGTESRAEQENYWLSELVNPAIIEQMKKAPLYEGWSTERLILERIQSSVEREYAYTPPYHARLQTLFPVYRQLAYQSMNEQEKESLAEWAKQVKASETVIEVTPEVKADIRWLWSTFGLRVPTQGAGIEMLQNPPSRQLNSPQT